jgi:hypothetical protein
MQTGHYTIWKILNYPNLDQLIVPELQRDYVWSEEDVLDFLESLKEGLDNTEDVPYLGFIYAYYHKDSSYQYYLIDGQQRMTTIFLLLLACNRRLEKKLPPYLMKAGKLKLDYKVRQATHDFLKDLVMQPAEPGNIKQQLWYHNDYENDVTIQSMIRNYSAINTWLTDFDQERLSSFLKLVETVVGLSYFDVENGRQGEELYIYMNSRGRQLEPNETLKAKFLSLTHNTDEKFYWGKRWEVWQDFFWKHRGINPDADLGFNEFLKRVQLINMSALNRSNDAISSFATGRSTQKLESDLLPKSLQEIDAYFDAHRFLVESDKIQQFLNKYESSFSFLMTPIAERRQVYYLRTLPLLALVARTNLRDEETLIRFVRFFYNVARKQNVGKDISNQLPIAIKLILEYTNRVSADFDVADFENYQAGRTVLVDGEEVLKFGIYKNPPKNLSRTEIEKEFWAAEDHEIFRGEITFLLSNSYHEGDEDFNFENFKKDWLSFQTMFPAKGSNKRAIIRTLLFYGNTWTDHTPHYYDNYKCDNWSEVVRNNSGKYLIRLISDMHDKEISFLDRIFEENVKNYFVNNSITTIESLKSQSGLFNQVKILTAIDYYTNNKLWNGSYHIAEEVRYSFGVYGDFPFFKDERLIYNVPKYISDGMHGRVINIMNNVLQNDVILNDTLAKILNVANATIDSHLTLPEHETALRGTIS